MLDQIAYWRTLSAEGRKHAMKRKEQEIKVIDSMKEITAPMIIRRAHLVEDLENIRLADS